MAVLRRFSLCLLLPFLFGGCNNLYLTAPYRLSADAELFLDGKLVASANLDRSFTGDMGDYGYYVESGSNPVNALAELFIFQRRVSMEEITFLYYNMGSTPSYDSLTGYYHLSGSLVIDANVGLMYGTGDGSVEKGDAPTYPVLSGGVIVTSPASDSRLRFYSPAPFSDDDSLTVCFWFQEETDNGSIVNLFRIIDRSDSSRPSIDLSLEPGGNLVLTLGTNWSKIVCPLDRDFDDTDGHMVTLRLENR